ncbi:MAG: hypothetical protein HYV26_08640 [Candidatus Hydrogenedentes bacterium]|nr:hypothetical protein [Candidatus Hydrogenedentota bacterium]
MIQIYFRRGALVLILGVLLSSVAQADPNPPSIRSTQGAWKITRQWNAAETQHSAQWMENIYKLKTQGSVEQRIAKLQRILTDPQMNLLEQPDFLGQGSNPQIPAGIIRMAHASIDCAKLTAFLPAYYAYRRGLPWMFSYVYSTGGDVRTATNAVSATVSSFESGSLSNFFTSLITGYSSGNYRVELNARNAHLSDTVPVAIDKKYLMAGCPNYTDGHCLILADVDKYGELHFINSSTTTTRDIFTYNGMNTVSGIAARGSNPANEWADCFQGLRVWRYPIAETNASGVVTRVRRRTNEEMKEFGFSTEQYDLIREITNTQQIDLGGLKAQSFHDVIRLRMRSVDRIAPLQFMTEYADDLLEVYRLREDFVQEAWRDHRTNGPIVYPQQRDDENIFQALGRWETWSSPSSDVDRRNKYFYLSEWVDYAVRWFDLMPGFVDLIGLEKYGIKTQADLLRALIQEKERLFGEREMYYTKSNGEKVRLTLLDIEDRLYDMSFDPNHPPELRWGAPMDSPERATAPQTFTPVPGGARVAMEDAYRWQRYYRCVGTRETEMSFLQDMFTEGFPIRSKFDEQLETWLRYYENKSEVDRVAEANHTTAQRQQREQHGVVQPQY